MQELGIYLTTPIFPSLRDSCRIFILASCLSAFETDINRSDSTLIRCIISTKDDAYSFSEKFESLAWLEINQENVLHYLTRNRAIKYSNDIYRL